MPEAEQTRKAHTYRVLRTLYARWVNRTPLLFVLFPSPRKHVCAAVMMINPSHGSGDPDESSGWSDHVLFGRVLNPRECFVRQLEMLEFEELVHREPVFREFSIDTDLYATQLRLAVDPTYPVLKVGLKKPEYSVHQMERLYLFYVCRRLASADAAYESLQFEMKPAIVSDIAFVHKEGAW